MENAFFSQIKNEVTEYSKSIGKIGKLRLIGTISRVLGLFLLIFTIVLCTLAVFTFAAVATINAMSACMPVWAASLIIGGVYILLILIAVLCRKPLFINPFIKLLAKQITTEDALTREIMDAEHNAEVQKIRIACHVENATRELDFYAGLLSRLWNVFRGILKK